MKLLSVSSPPRPGARALATPAVFAALVSIAWAAAPAGGVEPAPGQLPAPPTEQTPAVAAVPALLPSGLLVFVDPATGRILDRPRPEQLAALRALRLTQAARIATEEERQRELDALPRYTVPGGFGVDVEGHFLSALVVQRDPDGSLRFRCSDSQHDSHDHPAGAPVPPAAPPEL